MASTDILRIDGSYGEGGGQIVRNALALSVLTGRTVQISRIRAGRMKPGLRPQHLAAVRGAALISNAGVKGAEIGSMELLFSPGKVSAGDYEINIGTAGSITLLLQCLLPPLISVRERTTIRMTGGTDVPFSPPIDWVRNVLLPVLEQMGIKMELKIIRRGFYPAGGGEVEVRISGNDYLRPLRLERTTPGKIAIYGRAFASNLPSHIPERMAKSAEEILERVSGEGIEFNIENAQKKGAGKGAGITLWAEGKEESFFRPGASAIGERGVSSEKLGKMAADALISELKGGFPLDIHAADQLPVFVPLIKSRSGPRLLYPVREKTPHLMTALWLLERFGFSSGVREEKRQNVVVFA